jgi:hypothetical protein
MIPSPTSKVIIILLALISVGCMSDTGRVYVDTKPQGATVYVNDHMIGKTPVDFEFTHDFAVELRIEKDGYYPIYEKLDTAWVQIQWSKGNYKEYRERVTMFDPYAGSTTAQVKKWKIVTTYELKEANEK